jgi:hypothetical protein
MDSPEVNPQDVEELDLRFERMLNRAWRQHMRYRRTREDFPELDFPTFATSLFNIPTERCVKWMQKRGLTTASTPPSETR